MLQVDAWKMTDPVVQLGDEPSSAAAPSSRDSVRAEQVSKPALQLEFVCKASSDCTHELGELEDRNRARLPC